MEDITICIWQCWQWLWWNCEHCSVWKVGHHRHRSVCVILSTAFSSQSYCVCATWLNYCVCLLPQHHNHYISDIDCYSADHRTEGRSCRPQLGSRLVNLYISVCVCVHNCICVHVCTYMVHTHIHSSTHICTDNTFTMHFVC